MAKILVVDDDHTVREVAVSYLRAGGHEVDDVDTGEAALKAMREAPADLVVLDLMLPGIDGLEVCRRLREQRDVPIIMLTALGSEADRVVGLERGADDYVTKPFSPRELVLRVDSVLRRAGEKTLPRAGTLVDGDHLLAVLAIDRQARGALPHDTVVATVMSNLGFRQGMARRGIRVVDTKVGDRYVLEGLERTGAALGGEQSGHIILSDHSTTGDGLVAALQVLAVVKRRDRPVSEVCHRFEPLPQVLKNVRFVDRRTLAQEGVIRASDGGRERLGQGGRLLIRPSGTEPVVRVMGEGDDRALVEAVVDDVCAALSSHSSAMAAE